MFLLYKFPCKVEVLFGSFDQALYLMRMISHPSHNFFTVINTTSVSD